MTETTGRVLFVTVPTLRERLVEVDTTAEHVAASAPAWVDGARVVVVDLDTLRHAVLDIPPDDDSESVLARLHDAIDSLSTLN